MVEVKNKDLELINLLYSTLGDGRGEEGRGGVTILVDSCSYQQQKLNKHSTIPNQVSTKFTYEQYATVNQSNAGRFDPRVFVNCLQVVSLAVLFNKAQKLSD